VIHADRDHRWIQDDWDASSDEEENIPASAPVAPPRKKGTLKAVLAAKEAEKARRKAAGEDEDEAEEDEESEVDEIEQKRRDKQREIETDILNATSLLNGTSVSSTYSCFILRALIAYHTASLKIRRQTCRGTRDIIS
jgi:hypothetical protein